MTPFFRSARSLFLILAAVLVTLAAPLAVRAQDDLTDTDYAEMGEAGPIVREIRPLKDKTVVLVFDISGSMRDGGMLKRARQAAIQIVRNGVNRGDSVALFMFGPSYQTFEKKIENGDDRKAILDKIPFEPGADAGTNIRKPHHDALKLLDSRQPKPGVIILLTDSFNDEPKKTDPAYKGGYVSYYVPGQLTKYPKTPENGDYEGLLEKLVASGKVKQYGIGVNILPNGRPQERVPQGAPAPVVVPETDTGPSGAPDLPKPPDLTLLWLLLGVGVVAVAGFLLAPLFKPMALRISTGTASPKDFQLSGSQGIRLGGDGANFAPDAYPIPGTTAPLATIKLSGGKPLLTPAAGVTGNEKGQPRVFHNGLPLEAPVVLAYGDEVKVTVPQANGGVPKDIRLKFSDPRS